jgi:hypothetical protein
MDACLRNLIAMGAPLADAVHRRRGSRPARGPAGSRGAAGGRHRDVAVLDDDLRVARTVVDGIEARG